MVNRTEETQIELENKIGKIDRKLVELDRELDAPALSGTELQLIAEQTAEVEGELHDLQRALRSLRECDRLQSVLSGVKKKHTGRKVL